jgi:hypothetical protein
MSLPPRVASPFAMLGIAVFILVASVLGRPASAATFLYSSTCDPLPCPDIGLYVGDPVSGIFVFPDAVVTPGGSLSAADLIGLELDFGTIDINLASVAAIGFDAVLDASATGFVSFALIVSDALNTTGGLLQLDIPFWGAAVGGCLSPDCADLFFVDGSFGLGATITRVTAAIPEPAAALCLALPLAALSIRRQKARVQQC